MLKWAFYLNAFIGTRQFPANVSSKGELSLLSDWREMWKNAWKIVFLNWKYFLSCEILATFFRDFYQLLSYNWRCISLPVCFQSHGWWFDRSFQNNKFRKYFNVYNLFELKKFVTKKFKFVSGCRSQLRLYISYIDSYFQPLTMTMQTKLTKKSVILTFFEHIIPCLYNYEQWVVEIWYFEYISRFYKT